MAKSQELRLLGDGESKTLEVKTLQARSVQVMRKLAGMAQAACHANPKFVASHTPPTSSLTIWDSKSLGFSYEIPEVRAVHASPEDPVFAYAA